MKHLTHDQLSAQLDHALTGRARVEAEAHLASCEACRMALADLAAQETELKSVIAHDPGEAYFEDFAARVEDRIRAAGLAGAQARERRGLGSFWTSPRGLAWAGGAAAVIAGAGLVLMTAREVRPPALRDRDLSSRVEQQSGRRDAPAQELSEPPPAAAPAPGAGPPRELDAREEGEAREALGAKQGSADERTFAAPPPALTRESSAPSAPPGDRSAAAGSRAASPTRASEVRLNEAGDPIPVRRQGEAPLVQTKPQNAPAPAAGLADQIDGVRKKLFAQPLKDEKNAEKSALAPQDAANPTAPAPTAPGPARAGEPAAAAPALGLLASGETVEGRLCGEVRDSRDRPIVGAQVVLTDIARTATTDARGAFCVTAPAGEHALTVMAVGFTESRQSVQIGAQESSVRVTLAPVQVLAGGNTWGNAKSLYRGEPTQSRAGSQAPVAGADDLGAYAAAPDTVRREARAAQQLDASGAARRSAALYDAAAARWERVLRPVMGGPLELETRWHLAESRFHAWAAGPNARRAGAAVEALTAYAVRAPAGPRRDQATRWLDQVRR